MQSLTPVPNQQSRASVARRKPWSGAFWPSFSGRVSGPSFQVLYLHGIEANQ